MFYALGRSGVSLERKTCSRCPRTSCAARSSEALAEGIVDAAELGDPGELAERLGARVVEDVVRPGREPHQPGLVDVLAAADLPSETIANVLRSYRARPATAEEFWESFAAGGETAEGVDEETAREVEVAVRLGEVLGVDPPLLRRMHVLRREGGWQDPKDLSRYSFDDWCDVVEEVEPAPDMEGLDAEEAAAEDEEYNEWIEERADAILDTLENAFPSEFIRRRLAESEDVGAPARRLLERARRPRLRRRVDPRSSGRPTRACSKGSPRARRKRRWRKWRRSSVSAA